MQVNSHVNSAGQYSQAPNFLPSTMYYVENLYTDFQIFKENIIKRNQLLQYKTGQL